MRRLAAAGRPRLALTHCRCAITVGVRSDLCCHLTNNMLYQCKVPTLCELRSNHIVQIVFSSFPVVPTGNFCTTGEMETLCRLATEIPVLNFVNPTLTNPTLTLTKPNLTFGLD